MPKPGGDPQACQVSSPVSFLLSQKGEAVREEALVFRVFSGAGGGDVLEDPKHHQSRCADPRGRSSSGLTGVACSRPFTPTRPTSRVALLGGGAMARRSAGQSPLVPLPF